MVRELRTPLPPLLLIPQTNPASGATRQGVVVPFTRLAAASRRFKQEQAGARAGRGEALSARRSRQVRPSSPCDDTGVRSATVPPVSAEVWRIFFAHTAGERLRSQHPHFTVPAFFQIFVSCTSTARETLRFSRSLGQLLFTSFVNTNGQTYLHCW
jgi:hypothetical protein